MIGAKQTISRARRVSVLVVATSFLACEPAALSPDRAEPRSVDKAATTQDAVYSGWSLASSIESVAGTSTSLNTVSSDGCPFVSRDGKTLFLASNRAGSNGLDIWVSTRASENDGWGEPVNVAALNSTADDFCPTIARDDHLFYFVSRRSGGCGGSDVYVSRRREGLDFDPPQLLPCTKEPPYNAVNSPFDEWSPYPILEPGSGPALYFSSFRPGGFAPENGGAPDSDIYRSESHGGVFGLAAPVPGVNTTADDGQPNVSGDGTELFFFSARVEPGVSQGATDLYVASRSSAFDAWSTPLNLGPNVNGPFAESRPSLSWDGTTLYFGSTRPGEGAADIYITRRQKVRP